MVPPHRTGPTAPRHAGIYHADITVYVDDYNSEYASITIEVLPEGQSDTP